MISTAGQLTSTGTGPLRPSRYWYLIAGVLLAAAVACLTAAVIGIFSWDREIQDFQRVPVPGRGEVTLTQPGEYVLYLEAPGACCSWTVGSQGGPLAAWSMHLAIGPANGGPETRVSIWTGLPESYGVGGHQGVTAMSFTITQPGTYVIETGNVRPAAVTDLAVGQNILGPTLRPLVLLVAGLAGLLGAVLSFVLTAVRRRQARRRQGQPPEVMQPGPWSPASDAPGASAPVLVGFAGPARQNRGTVLFRAILAVPVLICLSFVRYAAWVVLVTGWLGALFTGRLPRYAASFLAAYQRWEVRTYAYLLLLTDAYPPFGFLDADYPVSVSIGPGRLNRAAVLFRLLLVFPAWVVTTILWYGLGPILMIPVWLIVLVGGRMPQPLYEAIAACLRYWARTKAYWYMLTDVYPDGLFGDPAGPAPGAAGPVFDAAGPVFGAAGPTFGAAGPVFGAAGPTFGAAGPEFGAPGPAFGGAEPGFGGAGPDATWAPPAAGPAGWPSPSVGGQEPPQPEAVPTDYPVPLPADIVGPAGATAATPATAAAAAPERLVLSRAGKRLVGLILAIGAATPAAVFALFFVQLALAPAPGPAAGSVPVAAAAPTASAAPAPAPSTAPRGRALSTADWLKGLSSLSAAMNRAMGAGGQVLTSVSLRSTARQLARCSAELSALGPPTTQLRHVDRLAVRACQGFEEGARYLAAAAGLMNPDGSAIDQAKVNKLINRGDAGVNRGSNLISIAVADGSFIVPPG